MENWWGDAYLAMEMSIGQNTGVKGRVSPKEKDIRDLWKSTISKLNLIDKWIDRQTDRKLGIVEHM